MSWLAIKLCERIDPATGLYLLALLCDLLDHQISALTGLVSGHTMKHAIAALAIYGVLLRLKRRRIMGHRK